MKKTLIVLGLIVLMGSLCQAGITFKLRGGMGYITGGDWNKGIDGLNAYNIAQADTHTGQFDKLDWGMDLDGEIIFTLGDYFGIGIGGGYLKVSKTSNFEMAGSDWIFAFSEKHTWTHGLTVIPIVLNLHYNIPLGKSLNFTIALGGGYYLGKFNFKNVYDTSWFILANQGTETYEASKGSIGFQGALGLEIKLAKNIALALDFGGRYVQFKELSGKLTDVGVSNIGGSYSTSEEDNRVWVYDHTSGGTTYRLLDLGKYQPAGADVTNPKQAVFDITGFAVKLGICIGL